MLHPRPFVQQLHQLWRSERYPQKLLGLIYLTPEARTAVVKELLEPHARKH
ncbi:hypothetical protein PMPD1_3163 [Paramixta manurensis]|uniref:Uncharacterized protein n=1 Tax=Paramixta manurensis TaxID=2740817 RepID=A0A6M8UGU6_9GAMM|nr:hypothetical protein PMPD1_3163 [Erwiniaceae bacterium PD-1]